MSKYVIDLDLDKCCACGACAVACMDQNDTDITGDTPFRQIFTLENPGKGTVKYVSTACMHCDDAPCILACPIGCLSKDEKTGFTVFDDTNCIGCHSCALACPFGAPCFAPDGKMHKCDGCAVRMAHGMQPACVRTCTVEALRVRSEEEQKEDKTGSWLKKFADMV